MGEVYRKPRLVSRPPAPPDGGQDLVIGRKAERGFLRDAATPPPTR